MTNRRKDFPLVSILIPVFNGANYLEEAIESALNQDYPNIEILLINDGSNDGGQTSAILRNYEDKVRVFNKENGGVASALNLGIKNMKGDFFSWLSHDDLYYPSKISEAFEAYQNQSHENVIIYSDYLVFSSDNPSGYLEKMSKISPSQFRYWLITKSQLHGCTLFIPKTAFIECGNFDETLKTTQDYDMWFRMSRKYDFIYLDKCLVKFRIHPSQDSNKLKVTALAECNVFYERATLELSATEVISGSKADLMSGLEGMLVNFQSRGWNTAAENLSIKLGVRTGIAEIRTRSIKQLLKRIIRRLIRIFN